MTGLGKATFQARLLDLGLSVIQRGTMFCVNANISICTLLAFLTLAELLLLASVVCSSKTKVFTAYASASDTGKVTAAFQETENKQRTNPEQCH